MSVTAFNWRGGRHNAIRPSPWDSTWGGTLFKKAMVLASHRHFFVKQGTYDLVLLKYLNIPGAVYCHYCLGYDVTWGGAVVIVLGEHLEGWIVNSIRFHGPNVVSCRLVAGYQQTPLIEAYLPLSTLDHLLDLEEVLNRFPGRDPVILGDLNVGNGRLRNPRDQQVAELLVSFWLVDLLAHI